MNEVIQQSALVSTILIIWLKTDAFYEYCKLFGIKKSFKIKEYSDFVEFTPEVGYLEYLKIERDCFLIRLITCPVCLGVWLNLIISLCLLDFSLFFVKLWLSFLLYFIIILVMKKSE